MKTKFTAYLIIVILIIGAFFLFREREVKQQELINVPEVKEPEPEPAVVEEVIKYIFIPDTFNNRIQIFDPDGNYINSIGKFGFDKEELRFPLDAIYFDDKVYVLDRGNNKIKVFDLNGTFLFLFDNKEIDILLPYDIDIFDNKLYIIDTFNNKVKIVDLNGKLLYQFGNMSSYAFTNISTRKNLKFPLGLAVNKDYIYISDTMNNRIAVFTHDGNFVKEFGNDLKKPFGITLYNDLIYVADSDNSMVKVYNTDGELINSFGSYGTKEEQFKHPSKMWIINDHIYIADTMNHRIKVYTLDGKLDFIFGRFGNRPGEFKFPGGKRKVSNVYSSLSLSSSV
ncbi:MAG: NHL repeat-containing protein [Nanoarchaeota archaeon]